MVTGVVFGVILAQNRTVEMTLLALRGDDAGHAGDRHCAAGGHLGRARQRMARAAHSRLARGVLSDAVQRRSV